jgi:hypothetical protein
MTREMAMPARLDDFDRLCCNAVAAHGGDWELVEKTVTERLAEMPVARRDRILKAVSDVLSFEPPRPGTGRS